MEKTINLSKTVYELANQDSQIVDILFELGFKEITKAGMLNTAGRFMTIPKGAQMKKIDMKLIEKTLSEKGYVIVR